MGAAGTTAGAKHKRRGGLATRSTWNQGNVASVPGFLNAMMFLARFRAPPCPRKGLRPPGMIAFRILFSVNSFLPERADSGRNGKELT